MNDAICAEIEANARSTSAIVATRVPPRSGVAGRVSKAEPPPESTSPTSPYATLMLEDGEELAVVSRSLGHADLSTTADIYAHLTPAMLRRSAERMDGILGERRASRATS
jgi:integrase